jgi:hypothetical protein
MEAKKNPARERKEKKVGKIVVPSEVSSKTNYVIQCAREGWLSLKNFFSIFFFSIFLWRGRWGRKVGD